MIEISEKKYWKKMRYVEAVEYCSTLEINGKGDWRMLKNYDEIRDNIEEDDRMRWYQTDSDYAHDDTYMTYKWWVIPVREV